MTEHEGTQQTPGLVLRFNIAKIVFILLLTIGHHILHLLPLLVREVAEHRKHGHTAQEADSGIHRGDYEGVTQDWALEFVVAAECYQRTKCNPY